MPQKYKIDEVQNLIERLRDAKSIVLVDYKGINIEQVDELRNRLRNENVDYFVSKNTFIKIALNEVGVTALDSSCVGPTAVAVSKVDEVTPARVLVNFKKEVMGDKEFPTLKMGYVAGTKMDVNDLVKLADLPTRDQLLSMVLQGFNAPITGFVGACSGIIRKFVYAVDAIAKEKADQ